MELTKLAIKRIPAGALGTLLMYQAGIDPKKKWCLRTFNTHKQILKSHGYDISKPLKEVRQEEKAEEKA